MSPKESPPRKDPVRKQPPKKMRVREYILGPFSDEKVINDYQQVGVHITEHHIEAITRVGRELANERGEPGSRVLYGPLHKGPRNTLGRQALQLYAEMYKRVKADTYGKRVFAEGYEDYGKRICQKLYQRARDQIWDPSTGGRMTANLPKSAERAANTTISRQYNSPPNPAPALKKLPEESASLLMQAAPLFSEAPNSPSKPGPVALPKQYANLSTPATPALSELSTLITTPSKTRHTPISQIAPPNSLSDWDFWSRGLRFKDDLGSVMEVSLEELLPENGETHNIIERCRTGAQTPIFLRKQLRYDRLMQALTDDMCFQFVAETDRIFIRHLPITDNQTLRNAMRYLLEGNQDAYNDGNVYKPGSKREPLEA